MITNTGKNILSKYLVGQAPAYASYIAVGCGAKPRSSDHTFTTEELTEFSAKNNLDFEMFRIPIVSRGFVNENGINKIVLTAELPTEERYEFSEVGIFSAGSNPSAGAYDSKTIYSFSQNENWEYHTSTQAISIPIIYEPLDGEAKDNVINQTDKVFQTNADNRIFTDSTRVERNERCRFLNNIVAISGDTSDISVNGQNNLVVNSGDHIHLNGINLDFNKQSPLDELRLAFSVVNKDGDENIKPSQILIMVEFASVDQSGAGEHARFEVNISNIDNDPTYDFDTNRYFIIKKQLQELVKSSGFSWGAMSIAKIYVSVLDSLGEPSDKFYVCLDAMRLENIGTQNPLYGLTGYSVIKNINSQTIIKAANSTNFIEFRFAVGVQ